MYKLLCTLFLLRFKLLLLFCFFTKKVSLQSTHVELTGCQACKIPCLALGCSSPETPQQRELAPALCYTPSSPSQDATQGSINILTSINIMCSVGFPLTHPCIEGSCTFTPSELQAETHCSQWHFLIVQSESEGCSHGIKMHVSVSLHRPSRSTFLLLHLRKQRCTLMNAAVFHDLICIVVGNCLTMELFFCGVPKPRRITKDFCLQ